MAGRHQFHAKWHDYDDGIYFVTVCCADHRHFFGEISDGKISLSPVGMIADTCLTAIPDHSSYTDLINHIVMPNHIHMIIGIRQPVGTRHVASLPVLSCITAMAEVRLPAIPDTITAPVARADWLTAHFWDDNDLATPGPALEEAFATFASLLPHASAEGRAAAARIFAAGAPRDKDVREAVAGIVESYLLDRHSPVHDEDAYALLATAMIAEGWPGREAMEYLCAMTRMARPGTPAPDLTYTDRAGDSHTLATTVGTVPTLLLFHSPGCGECEEMIAALRNDSDLSRRVADGALRVLAIAIYAPREQWMRHDALPAGWLDGHTDTDPADAGYSVPYTPTLYLIDRDGNILLKDATPDDIKTALR